MGQIIMRNCDWREFGVRDNLPSLIWQARVPIRRVITPIQGFPTQSGESLHRYEVFPTWSWNSYPWFLTSACILHIIPIFIPHRSLSLDHNSTIIAEYKVKSSLSITPCHDHELTPSTSIHRVQRTPTTAYTKYNIHEVQHTQSTASTQDCLSSLHSYGYELTPECSFSFQCASLHDWPPSAISPWELKGKVTFSHSHSCELTHWWIEY